MPEMPGPASSRRTSLFGRIPLKGAIPPALRAWLVLGGGSQLGEPTRRPLFVYREGRWRTARRSSTAGGCRGRTILRLFESRARRCPWSCDRTDGEVGDLHGSRSVRRSRSSALHLAKLKRPNAATTALLCVAARLQHSPIEVANLDAPFESRPGWRTALAGGDQQVPFAYQVRALQGCGPAGSKA